jgi:hypothetical protein
MNGKRLASSEVAVVKAVIREGVIRPLSPLPEHWDEGQELEIEEANRQDRQEDLEQWSQEFDRLTAKIPQDDFERLEAALSEADLEAKEYVKRQMGLS